MPKIYVYRPRQEGECGGVAYTADGELLAFHVSSNYGHFRRDMGLDEGQHIGIIKRARYAEKYPEGYELVEVIGRDKLQEYIASGEITGLTFDSGCE